MGGGGAPPPPDPSLNLTHVEFLKILFNTETFDLLSPVIYLNDYISLVKQHITTFLGSPWDGPPPPDPPLNLTHVKYLKILFSTEIFDLLSPVIYI